MTRVATPATSVSPWCPLGMLCFIALSSTQRPNGCCLASDHLKIERLASHVDLRSLLTSSAMAFVPCTPRAGLLHPRVRCWSRFYPTHHCHLRRRHRLCFVFAIILLAAILILISSLGSSSLLPSSLSSPSSSPSPHELSAAALPPSSAASSISL